MSAPSDPYRISARRLAQLVGIGVAGFVLYALVVLTPGRGHDNSRMRLTICVSKQNQVVATGWRSAAAAG